MPDIRLMYWTGLYQEVNVRTAVNEQIGVVRSELSAVRGDMLTQFDEVYRRFDRLEPGVVLRYRLPWLARPLR